MKHKTVKVCQKCGKPFSREYANYCEDCGKEIKKNSVVRIRVCQDCGAEFYGGPRAKRCGECAEIAKKNYIKNYKKRTAKRKIGSTDICQMCGAEYVVNGGRQKYCSDECARTATLQWQREHKTGYAKESGQYEKRNSLRQNQKKICVYCGRVFSGRPSSNTCSEYCRIKNREIVMCRSEIRCGRKRDLETLIAEQENYRKQVQTETTCTK